MRKGSVGGRVGAYLKLINIQATNRELSGVYIDKTYWETHYTTVRAFGVSRGLRFGLLDMLEHSGTQDPLPCCPLENSVPRVSTCFVFKTCVTAYLCRSLVFLSLSELILRFLVYFVFLLTRQLLLLFSNLSTSKRIMAAWSGFSDNTHTHYWVIFSKQTDAGRHYESYIEVRTKISAMSQKMKVSVRGGNVS